MMMGMRRGVDEAIYGDNEGDDDEGEGGGAGFGADIVLTASDLGLTSGGGIISAKPPPSFPPSPPPMFSARGGDDGTRDAGIAASAMGGALLATGLASGLASVDEDEEEEGEDVGAVGRGKARAGVNASRATAARRAAGSPSKRSGRSTRRRMALAHGKSAEEVRAEKAVLRRNNWRSSGDSQ